MLKVEYIGFRRTVYDDARHCARTINRGSGAVLQDVEGLDVVGVEAGDGGGDQGRGVTGGEIVGGDVHDVFHDHAVHDPQRLGGAVDGGRATHADLRRGAEGAGHVLDRNARDLAFQGTGDIGDTGQFGVFGVDLRGRTGVEPAVDGLHTGGYGGVKDGGIILEDKFQGGAERLALVLVTHAGCNDILGLFRHVLEREQTVQVRKRSHGLEAFHVDSRSDDGFPVHVHDGTVDRRLGRCESHAAKQGRQKHN